MENKLIFKNYTEIFVDKAVDNLWSDMEDICKCKRCYYDTKALSLNHLPSKYIVSSDGEVYTKIKNFKKDVQVNVMTEVMKAIMIVNESYSHPAEEKVHKKNF